VIPLEARLDALARRGAARFDPEGFRLISRLIEGGLEARASQRVDKLEQEHAEAGREAEALLARLKLLEARIGADLTRAIDEGDYRVARRLAIVALGNVEADARSAVPRWALSIAAKARTRAVRLPRDLARRVDAFVDQPPSARGVDGELRALAAEVSRALFDDSIASTRATIAVARATDNVPESAGPYNTQALAAQALGALANLSPSYLRAYVATLDDLSALEPLAVIDSKSQPPPRRKRG
jgi:hypothetical protein